MSLRLGGKSWLVPHDDDQSLQVGLDLPCDTQGLVMKTFCIVLQERR